MPYRPPGAYARFIRSAGAVNSPGAQRIMALVGTGTMMYETHNEAIERDADRALRVTPYDELREDTAFEIITLSDKPKYNGAFPAGTKFFTKDKHFFVKEGKYVVWYTDNVNSPAKATEDTSVGNTDLASYVTAVVNANKYYLVEDGKWRIEVTYVDSTAGAYRVIDEETNEVVGEFATSTLVNKEAIPGVDLKVESTFFDDGGGNSTISVGDYVIIKTTAAVVPDEYVEYDSSSQPIESTRIDLPDPGSVYYVSYTYKKPESDFEPKVFFDYDDLVEEYGNYDVTASRKVINSLSLAGEIAFLNGAGPVVCVQAKSDSDFEMKNAINKLRKKISGLGPVHTIVPLTTSKNVGAHAMNHVIDMSSPLNAMECMTYLGLSHNETVLEASQAAKDYNNERVIYVGPEGAYKDIKDLRTGRVNRRIIDSPYLAVAVAALGIKNDPAEPLTRKSINGFAGLTQVWEESEMNLMANSGVLILQQHGPVIKVRHGLTTSTTDVNSAEITLIQIKDYVIAECRETLGDLYVGRKLLPSILSDVEISLKSILNQFTAQEVILGFEGLKVKRSKLDPRQVDVQFNIEAVYPLNYISIEFGFSNN